MKIECINNHAFTVVNQNTKKAKSIINSYKYSDFNATELYNVYNNFSDAKQNALNDCKKIRIDLDGVHGHIVSHNCEFFSYAFEFVNPNDGAIQIAYITPCNRYITDYVD